MNEEINEHDQKYKRLWAVVLLQAIKDIDENKVLWEWGRKNTQRIKDDALDWFKSDRSDYCSFIWICNILDLNAGTVRKKILSKNPDLKNPNFGHKIIRYRQENNLSQVALAERIGCAPSVLCNIEKSKTKKSFYAASLAGMVN